MKTGSNPDTPNIFMTNKVLLIHGLFTKRFFTYGKKIAGELRIGLETKQKPTEYKNHYTYIHRYAWTLEDFLNTIVV
jgi:hypothetical protein